MRGLVLLLLWYEFSLLNKEGAVKGFLGLDFFFNGFSGVILGVDLL
jgi:hypothetical protein